MRAASFTSSPRPVTSVRAEVVMEPMNTVDAQCKPNRNDSSLGSRSEPRATSASADRIECAAVMHANTASDSDAKHSTGKNTTTPSPT